MSDLAAIHQNSPPPHHRLRDFANADSAAEGSFRPNSRDVTYTRDPNAVLLSKPAPSVRRKPGAEFQFRPQNSLSPVQIKNDHGVVRKVESRPIQRQSPRTRRYEEETRSAKRRRLNPGRNLPIRGVREQTCSSRPAQSIAHSHSQTVQEHQPLMTSEYSATVNLVRDFIGKKGRQGTDRISPSSVASSIEGTLTPETNGRFAAGPSASLSPSLTQEMRCLPLKRKLPDWTKYTPSDKRNHSRHPSSKGLSVRDGMMQLSNDHAESDDELQALDVTVQQPSKQKSHTPITRHPSVSEPVGQKVSSKRSSIAQPSPIPDLLVLNSSICRKSILSEPHLMAIDWRSKKAHLEPPESSSHAHPQSVNLDKVISLIRPDDADGRTIMLKFMISSEESDNVATLEFDSRNTLDRFVTNLKQYCFVAQDSTKSSDWINRSVERHRNQQRQKDSGILLPDNIDTGAQPQSPAKPPPNPPKRQKLVHQLRIDEQKSSVHHPSDSVKQDITAETVNNEQSHHNGSISIPVKKYTPHQNTLPQRETRSMTQSRGNKPRPRSLSPIVKSPPQWSKPLIFPKTGKKRAEVEAQDLERLRDDEFLNDNLIGLYTRFLEYHFEQTRPDLFRRIYFFNSYFYARLTDRPRGQREINYTAVSKWTRSVDLFSFDYVVVPINENAHWFLAIICNLPKLFSVHQKGQTNDEIPASSQQESRSNEPLENNAESRSTTTGSTPDSQGRTLRENLKSMSLSDISSISSRKGGSKKKDSGHRRVYELGEPMIITCDSLGCPRSPIIKALKEYLVAEAKSKRNAEINKDMISGMTAKEIPLQRNYSDCGLYLLAYLERFSQNPDEFVSKLLKKEMNLETDWPQFNSRELRKRFRDFLLTLHDEQDERELDLARTHTRTTSKSLHVLLPPLHSDTQNNEEPTHDTRVLDAPEVDAKNECNTTTEKPRETDADASLPTSTSSPAKTGPEGSDDEDLIVLVGQDDVKE
ncbi:hypothetical protein KEM54_002841 [Ascosphaera aggregata]|nr:hypothetical protein KEM54_002841 [Ascosphaera aggregata]